MPSKYITLFNKELLKQPDDIIGEYDVMAALDCADKSRLGKALKFYKKHDNTINIDHHVTNDEFAKLNYVVEASSVGEIVFDILTELDIKLTDQIAKYLYTAISTDTGNFTYSNTSRNCMRIAAELIERFDLQTTADILFRQRSLATTQLTGRAISRLEMHEDGRIAVMTILLEDLTEFGADGSDCENIVNYAREIDTVAAAVFFRELHTGVKVSLRSKGDVDVCSIAAKFGGGGHKNASGCCIGEPIEQAKQKVLGMLTEIV